VCFIREKYESKKAGKYESMKVGKYEIRKVKEVI
jgi:hypothetical protein